MPKLTKVDLSNLKKISNYNKFTLKTLLEFYEEYICSIYYWFKLKDGTEIILNFFKENFCHLAGTHKVYPENLQKRYQGKEGYKKILNNKMTFKTLKNYNSSKFNADVIQRVEYFPFMLQLLDKAELVKFNPYKVSGKCNIKADIIFYSDMLGARVHLGAVKEKESKITYAPETFFPRELGKKSTNKYTINQDYKQIIDRKKFLKQRGRPLDYKFNNINWTSQNLKSKFKSIVESHEGAFYRKCSKEGVAALLSDKIDVVKIEINGTTYAIYKAKDDIKVDNKLCELKEKGA